MSVRLSAVYPPFRSAAEEDVSRASNVAFVVAWMDGPGDDVEGQTRYGTEYGFPYQEVTATVRVSVVTTQN